MKWRDVRQIALVEREFEIAFLDVQQVPVRRDEDGDVSQSRFGQNQSVVKFFIGKEPFLNEPPGELFGDAVADRFQVVRCNAPLPHLAQRRHRLFLFQAARVEREQRKLLDARGRNLEDVSLFPKNLDKGVREIFASGEIERDVSVESELLPCLQCRHKSPASRA